MPVLTKIPVVPQLPGGPAQYMPGGFRLPSGVPRAGISVSRPSGSGVQRKRFAKALVSAKELRRYWERRVQNPDDNTIIGLEVAKNLGAPAMLKATGPESNPDFEIIPLPGIDPKRIIRYKAQGRFLFPVLKKRRGARRSRAAARRAARPSWAVRPGAPRPARPGGSLSGYDGDYYQMSGFLSNLVKKIVPKARSLGKKLRHPVQYFKKPAREQRKLLRSITKLEKRGITPRTIQAPSGKSLFSDLLTPENLMAAKQYLAPGEMQDTYQDMIDNGQYVEAADMADSARPGLFSAGKAKAGFSKFLIPAVVIGGVYFLMKKGKI